MVIYMGFFGGVIKAVLTQSWIFFGPFLDFLPEVGMDVFEKLVPPYFGYG